MNRAAPINASVQPARTITPVNDGDTPPSANKPADQMLSKQSPSGRLFQIDRHAAPRFSGWSRDFNGMPSRGFFSDFDRSSCELFLSGIKVEINLSYIFNSDMIAEQFYRWNLFNARLSPIWKYFHSQFHSTDQHRLPVPSYFPRNTIAFELYHSRGHRFFFFSSSRW